MDTKPQLPKPPHLAEVIEQNIRKITDLSRKAIEKRGLQGKAADVITDFSGSMAFVYLHVAWFGFWILVNTGWLGLPKFDPFPYGLLTLVVSLEAIFLSAFVLISQNRLSDEADRRSKLDLQIGLLAEHEITRVLQMLDQIRHHLGVAGTQDKDLQELKKEIHPEDVLAEIERAQERLRGRKTAS